MASPAPSKTSFVALPGIAVPGATSADVNASAMRYPETNQPNTTLPTPGINPLSSTNTLPATPIESEQPLYFQESWTWQFLPDGLLYKSYLAGNREPRFASQWVHVRDVGWMWDVALGARAGILRYGTTDVTWPEGVQVDIEGAAFPRVNLDQNRDLETADFRFGVPLTMRQGPWQWKFGFYHLSSHLGNEYMVPMTHLIGLTFLAIVLFWAWDCI